MGRAEWNDRQGISRLHQLDFDRAKKSLIAEPKTMDRYNKLKIRTLKVFAFAPGAWFTPREVAERLNFLPKRAVWTYLKRLWKFSLLERHTSGTGTLKYKLSEGGAARLRWLQRG
jgi:hypothetical protein